MASGLTYIYKYKPTTKKSTTTYNSLCPVYKNILLDCTSVVKTQYQRQTSQLSYVHTISILSLTNNELSINCPWWSTFRDTLSCQYFNQTTKIYTCNLRNKTFFYRAQGFSFEHNCTDWVKP
jgi:hypothetical protein